VDPLTNPILLLYLAHHFNPIGPFHFPHPQQKDEVPTQKEKERY